MGSDDLNIGGLRNQGLGLRGSRLTPALKTLTYTSIMCLYIYIYIYIY